MDFEVYDQKPIYYNMKLMRSWLITPDLDQNVFQLLMKNFISTKDYWVPVAETYEGTFFKIAGLIERPYITGKFPGELLRVSSYLQEEAAFNEREVYNLIDLIGEMGGVVEIIVIVFGVIIYPISHQSFILNATSQLFKARTSD
jgi:hypothetical protein